jgi:hypothetical protein
MYQRETFYECVYESGQNQFRFQIRAWSEAEALASVRDALETAGVRVAGALQVKNLKGRVLRRATYAPGGRPQVAATAH